MKEVTELERKTGLTVHHLMVFVKMVRDEYQVRVDIEEARGRTFTPEYPI